MSYGGCENTPKEIEDLRGATITSAKIVKDDEFGTVAELKVKFRKGHKVVTPEGEAVGGLYQIWADPEGNGPGFLSMVGSLVMVPANAK